MILTTWESASLDDDPYHIATATGHRLSRIKEGGAHRAVSACSFSSLLDQCALACYTNSHQLTSFLELKCISRYPKGISFM